MRSEKDLYCREACTEWTIRKRVMTKDEFCLINYRRNRALIPANVGCLISKWSTTRLQSCIADRMYYIDRYDSSTYIDIRAAA